MDPQDDHTAEPRIGGGSGLPASQGREPADLQRVAEQERLLREAGRRSLWDRLVRLFKRT